MDRSPGEQEQHDRCHGTPRTDAQPVMSPADAARYADEQSPHPFASDPGCGPSGLASEAVVFGEVAVDLGAAERRSCLIDAGGVAAHPRPHEAGRPIVRDPVHETRPGSIRSNADSSASDWALASAVAPVPVIRYSRRRSRNPSIVLPGVGGIREGRCRVTSRGTVRRSRCRR
jgi:hypothetical protein